MRIFGRHIGRRKELLSCHQVAEVLQSFLDDELDIDVTRKVAAHLDDCRRCGLEAEIYEALEASLQRIPLDHREPVTRLREFGERLARGELDPGEMASR